jgi:hypothetical protein
MPPQALSVISLLQTISRFYGGNLSLLTYRSIIKNDGGERWRRNSVPVVMRGVPVRQSLLRREVVSYVLPLIEAQCVMRNAAARAFHQTIHGIQN